MSGECPVNRTVYGQPCDGPGSYYCDGDLWGSKCRAYYEQKREELRPAVPVVQGDDGLRDDDCGHDSWAGLMRLLDEHWPDDIFPTKYADDPKRDAGPRIVSLVRLVDRLLAERDQAVAQVARVEAALAAYDEASVLDAYAAHRFAGTIRRALDGDGDRQ